MTAKLPEKETARIYTIGYTQISPNKQRKNRLKAEKTFSPVLFL